MKFRQFFEDCCESFVSPNETLCIAWIKALSLIFMHFQNNCNRFIKDYLCERSDSSCNNVRISLFVEPCMYINRSNVCLHQHNSLYISLKKKRNYFHKILLVISFSSIFLNDSLSEAELIRVYIKIVDIICTNFINKH